MILISNMGNITGKNDILENTPDYIITAINRGYDCKIDIWYIEYTLYLGDHFPRTKITLEFLDLYKDKLWIHCKNIDALCFMNKYTDFNYFFQDKDKFSLTSKKFILGNFNGTINSNVICIVPDYLDYFNKEDLDKALGICSDNIYDYKQLFDKDDKFIR